MFAPTLQRLKESTTVAEFLVEFRELLETRVVLDAAPTAQFFVDLVKEVDAVGWDAIEAIDDSLSRLSIAIMCVVRCVRALHRILSSAATQAIANT